MARIYDLVDGSVECGLTQGAWSGCGQDGYGAQVLQYPIDTYHLFLFLCVFLDLYQIFWGMDITSNFWHNYESSQQY